MEKSTENATAKYTQKFKMLQELANGQNNALTLAADLDDKK
jgi:hypothetical protein